MDEQWIALILDWEEYEVWLEVAPGLRREGPIRVVPDPVPPNESAGAHDDVERSRPSVPSRLSDRRRQQCRSYGPTVRIESGPKV